MEDSKMKMLKNYSDDYTNVNLPQTITTWQLLKPIETKSEIIWVTNNSNSVDEVGSLR